MKISRHFSWDEVIRTQQRAWVDENARFAERMKAHVVEHAQLMDAVRDLLGQAVHVSSWVRCDGLNVAIGGSDTSDHTPGKLDQAGDIIRIGATDFTSPAFGSAFDVAQAIVDSDLPYRQVIYEYTWVHISSPRHIKGVAEIPRLQVLTLRKGGGYIPGLHR